MERLTNRYSDGTPFIPNCILQLTNGMTDVIKKLAEYEDLEEQGLLLRLPCKIGNLVYVIESECNGDFYDCHNHCEECRDFSRDVYSVSFSMELIDGFGNTVFLTKEEAERALAEMKGE